MTLHKNRNFILSFLPQFKILQERQIDKMFMLGDLVNDGDRLRESVKNIKNIVFVVKPKLELMEKIDKVVKAQERSTSGGVEKEFHLGSYYG